MKERLEREPRPHFPSEERVVILLQHPHCCWRAPRRRQQWMCSPPTRAQYIEQIQTASKQLDPSQQASHALVVTRRDGRIAHWQPSPCLIATQAHHKTCPPTPTPFPDAGRNVAWDRRRPRAIGGQRRFLEARRRTTHPGEAFAPKSIPRGHDFRS